jgi:glycosyltransferase involved in cell wall biosynthesis
MPAGDDGLVSAEVRKRLEEIGEVDILVGIPSYNNARTIAHVVKAVHAGLAKYFPDAKAVLVNSDGGSKDGTPSVVANTGLENLETILVDHPVFPINKIVTNYTGIPGKGSAFRLIFKIAELLQAKACCVVDSDLRSITPEWIELLIDPVLVRGFEYVAPLYKRHKYDGTITNGIVYPITRALYGKRIRQPIGGEFGFTGRLASHYLSKEVWDTDVARYGIDIWMTTTAVCDGFKVCQSYLGAKIHDAKDPAANLAAMFTQVVGSVFDLMDTYFEVWSNVQGSTSVPTFGFPYEVGLEPVRVNVENMISRFALGVRELRSVWEPVIGEQSCERLTASLAIEDLRQFRFPEDLWVRCVYDFAVAHHRRIWPRDQLLGSIIPLYLGRTASFVLETEESTADEVEAKIEGLCQLYESMKPHLLENWQ